MEGLPKVAETRTGLEASVPVGNGMQVRVEFRERAIEFRLLGAPPGSRLGLVFEWDPSQSAFREVMENSLRYRFRDFEYAVEVTGGTAEQVIDGVRMMGQKHGAVRLNLAQNS